MLVNKSLHYTVTRNKKCTKEIKVFKCPHCKCLFHFTMQNLKPLPAREASDVLQLNYPLYNESDL